ncbi:immunity protein Imm1 of predicted polymorphic toxin system [Halopolyspora algeriensis]|uniref:Immunity protein Imm1 of predicted polymorphic toxin system n=1 Tax=Halopolyspora algeriensis TaxID=1500506 RepID=A0A368VDK8_9ACTN|nr:Imm1 family immunity protein [Halopolyspora algeriensis]RCW39186.1 immunity protein Imm1 of predicted polymorphic toxin system [Halopolyspora algeriensis]TQM47446.1 immunity protein Imm1 of predicted polymorphic toxin system [Halopolyspora algeriensis]
MILNAVLDDGFEYAETPEQADALVRRVVSELRSGNPWVNMDAGDEVTFVLGDRKYTDEDLFGNWDPYGELQVTANTRTGFGAVRWNYRFMSCSAEPPWDPQVIGDPGFPRWYHPRYVIPLARVEESVREFSRTGGQRPGCIEWAEDGGDHDRLYLDAVQYRAMFRHAA